MIKIDYNDVIYGIDYIVFSDNNDNITIGVDVYYDDIKIYELTNKEYKSLDDFKNIMNDVKSFLNSVNKDISLLTDICVSYIKENFVVVK